MSGGTSKARWLVPGIVVLLAVVAIAASGSAPSGTGGSRTPSQWFLDVFASVVLIAMALGTVLLVVLVVLRPQELIDQVGARERRRGKATATVALVVVAALLAFAIRRFVGSNGDSGPGIDAGGVTDAAASIGSTRYEPHFATSAVVVLLVVVAVTIVAALLVARSRRKSAADEGALEEELALVLDETLDDLRAETDPRRAVIVAYARLEQVFAAHGVPRSPAEAPNEYLARVLASLEVPPRPASRLTKLFATAKFSQHDVAPSTKDEAIAALEEARDALRQAAEHARAEREQAVSTARERAAT